MKPIFKYNSAPSPLGGTPAAQLQATFNQAIALHQRGQLAQAKALYENILAKQPQHYQSLHLLGLVAAQSGRFPEAVELIGKAIALFPNNADFYMNRGNALKALGQVQAAVEHYDKAIALKPDYADAFSNRAVALQELRQYAAAIASYDKAISLRPDHAHAYSNRAVALLELGQLEAALASCDQAIAIKSDLAEAHFGRGNVLMAQGHYEAAAQSYAKAAAARPSYAEAHFRRGAALQALNQLDAAMASYDQAIAVRPDYAEAYYNRGVAQFELLQWAAAVDSYDKAIERHPAFALALCNRGIALQALKQLDGAVASFDQAIALEPDNADFHANRAIALFRMQRIDDAIAGYDAAICLDASHVKAHINRGIALLAQKNVAEALASYDKAISLQPDYAETYFYKSLALLLSGDYARGWELYPWLWKTQAQAPKLRHFPQPSWTGEEPLQDKTVLVHSEQGFGDMLEFCRYCKLLAERGARVVLEVPNALMGLLSGLDGVAELVAKGSPLPAFDYHCLLMALPVLFKTELHTIPGEPGYVRSSAAKVQEWSERLGSKTQPRVGIVWSGNVEQVNDYNRSMSLATFAAQLPDGYEYVCLQKEVRDSDRQTLEQLPHIRYFADGLKDFSDTAALCDLVDLVISVDTSVAHLSGAMGRPTWVLLTYVPDWRWLLEGEDCPWYRTAKLIRQSSDGDWDGVLAKVRQDLLQRSAGTRGPTPPPLSSL